jgi:hypothetical protein
MTARSVANKAIVRRLYEQVFEAGNSRSPTSWSPQTVATMPTAVTAGLTRGCRR